MSATTPSHSQAPAGSEGKSRTAPSYRPEVTTGNTAGGQSDLFALAEVVDEYSLGKRLLQQGADLYCAGEFATHADRLRHVIGREQLAYAICGRDPAGKLERYAQAFERVCGEPLVKSKTGAKR